MFELGSTEGVPLPRPLRQDGCIEVLAAAFMISENCDRQLPPPAASRLPFRSLVVLPHFSSRSSFGRIPSYQLGIELGWDELLPSSSACSAILPTVQPAIADAAPGSTVPSEDIWSGRPTPYEALREEMWSDGSHPEPIRPRTVRSLITRGKIERFGADEVEVRIRRCGVDSAGRGRLHFKPRRSRPSPLVLLHLLRVTLW